MNWHTTSTDDTLDALETRPGGLTPDEAQHRLDEHGPNTVTEQDSTTWYAVLARQFTDPLILLLIAAGIVSALASDKPAEPIAIFVIVIINACIGFYQEYNAERALQALSNIAPDTTIVRRDNTEHEIPTNDIVPGDIIILHAGDSVPADARLLQADTLTTDEASLTGESQAVHKTTEPVPDETPLAERTSMVYAGTTVREGHGEAIVTDTGDDTEFGHVATSLGTVREGQTPLQKKFADLARQISYIAIGLITLVFLIGYFQWNDSLAELLIFALVLAVGTVPSALPLIVTFSLSLGARALANVNLLLRSLPAAESMGAVTYICTDKTGTLTKNEMTVQRLYIGDTTVDVPGTGYDDTHDLNVEPLLQPDLQRLATAAITCNDATVHYGDEIIGDPTEAALIVLANKAGIHNTPQRITEHPFDSDRKRMSVSTNDATYVKGAPETILERCNRIQQHGETRPITDDDKQQITTVQHNFAQDALRVLALAYKPTPTTDQDNAETDLIFLGLTGMQDPPRPGVTDAVNACRSAGINVMMITGDHITTAKAIADQLTITDGDAIEAHSIDAWTDDELNERVEDISVIARATPALKLRVINALQHHDHVVAMTGDGVNDAPALKKADVGLSMGITGTDVAKQASNGVLLDDEFTTIVDAIEEGRSIYNKIVKSAKYLLSCNFGEIVTVLGSLITFNQIPLQPLQILMINMLTDTAPAAGLSMEGKEDDVMRRPPRPLDEPPITKEKLITILSFGVIMGIVTTIMFGIHSHLGLAHAQTIAFTTLVVMQLFAVMSMRSFEATLTNLNLIENKALLGGIAVSIGLQLIAVYAPPAQALLGTVGLTGNQWLLITGVGLTSFLVFELAKAIVPRRIRTPQ